MDATGALTLLAGLVVATVHAIHISRRTTQVAEVALEAIHLNNLLHLF